MNGKLRVCKNTYMLLMSYEQKYESIHFHDIYHWLYQFWPNSFKNLLTI